MVQATGQTENEPKSGCNSTGCFVVFIIGFAALVLFNMKPSPFENPKGLLIGIPVVLIFGGWLWFVARTPTRFGRTAIPGKLSGAESLFAGGAAAIVFVVFFFGPLVAVPFIWFSDEPTAVKVVLTLAGLLWAGVLHGAYKSNRK